jgi:hypothetical protein
VIHLSGTIRFFDYNQRPKERIMDNQSPEYVKMDKQLQLKKYETLYKDKFCKAFKIECTDMDLRGFLYLVQKRILDRYTPEGVDFRPTGSNVRLYITPLKASMKLGILSYSGYDYSLELEKFQELTTGHKKKREDLESLMK